MSLQETNQEQVVKERVKEGRPQGECGALQMGVRGCIKKKDRSNSLLKFTVILWNIRVLRICLDLVSVIYSIRTELGKNTFFLCVCMYTEYSLTPTNVLFRVLYVIVTW